MVNIFLNTSEIASFVGQNKWDYITPFERLWKKYDNDYKICLEKCNNKIQDKKVQLVLIENEKRIINEKLNDKLITKRQHTKLLKENEVKKNEIDISIEQIEKQLDNISLTEVQKIEKDLGKDIIQTISSVDKETFDKRKLTTNLIKQMEKDGKIKEDKKQELLKQTESFINKTHGTLKEDSAITIFENKYNVKLDTNQNYYKYLVNKTNENTWYIGGKMDGIYVDNNNSNESYVVEVKNRTKGFFSTLRNYEKTQIQLYLLLTGFDKAKLVEKFNSRVRVTDIIRDQEYIDNILEYINIFIKSIEKFFKDFECKMQYIQMNETEKQKFLHTLYINDILKLEKYKQEIKIIENQTKEDDLSSDLDDF
jgi:hypothetical protein